MSDIPFEFTTTAMARPSLLDSTYQSFTSNIKGIDFRQSTVYINVDPIERFPDSPALQQQCIQVAQKYFGKVVSNCPASPSFPAAVKWCWSQATADWIFHLEDDWLLKKPVEIKTLLALRTHKYQVPLRAYRNNLYHRIVLSPSLLSDVVYKKAAQLLPLDKNPEHALRELCDLSRIPWKTRMPMAYPRNKNLVIITDIGRPWVHLHGIVRPAGPGFTRWQQ